MSGIIGRRQILLVALVLALAAAIFLNWKYSDTSGGFDLAGLLGTSSSLGDATYVDNQKTSGVDNTDYFAQAEVTRSKTRAQAQDVLQDILSNSSATEKQKQDATDQLTEIAKNITQEGNIENLVVAKGFSDCVAFVNDGTVSIVVKPKSGTELSKTDVAQITDIVISQTKVSAGNIKISEVK